MQEIKFEKLVNQGQFTCSYVYRKDPVAWTGKLGTFKCFRKIRTIQEKRWNEAHKNLVKIRGNRKNIPDDWDDIHRNNQRCWKKQRKTQYK